jgi:hypothetical protein
MRDCFPSFFCLTPSVNPKKIHRLEIYEKLLNFFDDKTEVEDKIKILRDQIAPSTQVSSRSGISSTSFGNDDNGAGVFPGSRQ